MNHDVGKRHFSLTSMSSSHLYAWRQQSTEIPKQNLNVTVSLYNLKSLGSNSGNKKTMKCFAGCKHAVLLRPIVIIVGINKYDEVIGF